MRNIQVYLIFDQSMVLLDSQIQLHLRKFVGHYLKKELIDKDIELSNNINNLISPIIILEELSEIILA